MKSINAGSPLLVTTMKLSGSPFHPVADLQPSVPTSPPQPASTPATAAATAPIPAPVDTATTPATPVPASQEQPATITPPGETVPANPAPVPAVPNKSGGAQTISNPEVQRLCESLKSDDPRLAIQALKSLRQINAPEAVPQILPCLNHGNFKVIREACRTLAVLGNRDVIPLLQPLLVRSDVRSDARAAIIKIANTHRSYGQVAIAP